MYSKTWTTFETQSLAFGLLRKNLYPKYLIRGDFGVIRIYRPTADVNNPTLLLTINVAATSMKNSDCFSKQKDGEYLMAGGGSAYNIVSLVTPLLS